MKCVIYLHKSICVLIVKNNHGSKDRNSLHQIGSDEISLLNIFLIFYCDCSICPSLQSRYSPGSRPQQCLLPVVYSGLNGICLNSHSCFLSVFFSFEDCSLPQTLAVSGGRASYFWSMINVCHV